MTFTYPYTIDNGGKEQLTFKTPVQENGVDKIEVENFVQPGGGPPMHVHYKQEESVTVVSGKIGIQVLGKQPEFYGPGQSVTFKQGVAHKFWNAGDEPLVCTGYVTPANNIVYFLSEIYRSTKSNGGERPGAFDAAFLLKRYKSEFNMLDVPPFVRKVIFPVILFFGKLSGMHKKFADAPAPLIP